MKRWVATSGRAAGRPTFSAKLKISKSTLSTSAMSLKWVWYMAIMDWWASGSPPLLVLESSKDWESCSGLALATLTKEGENPERPLDKFSFLSLWSLNYRAIAISWLFLRVWLLIEYSSSQPNISLWASVSFSSLSIPSARSGWNNFSGFDNSPIAHWIYTMSSFSFSIWGRRLILPSIFMIFSAGVLKAIRASLWPSVRDYFVRIVSKNFWKGTRPSCLASRSLNTLFATVLVRNLSKWRRLIICQISFSVMYPLPCESMRLNALRIEVLRSGLTSVFADLINFSINK